jgi:uncharacterized membrane protein YeaQ/YmgE (transglycosylase-associated protein family)
MDIWKHGKYVDTWSVVHFLSGLLLVGFFYKIGYEFIPALVFSTLLLLAWEVFEWIIKIIEPSVNVMVDIVVGLAGFFVGAYLYYVREAYSETLFYSALAVTVALAAWGLMDFLKKGYR